jgi:uncharacterized protein with FMN-binding domain
MDDTRKMETQNKFQKKLGIALGAIVIIALAAVSFAMSPDSDDSVMNTPATTTVPVVPPVTTVPVTTSPVTQVPPIDVPKQPVVSASTYKDGTYTAIGSYDSPGGMDHITVTLTLSNDIVTDVSAAEGAGDGTSRRYQQMFLSGYKSFVIGKDISTLNLTRVSGSSLTPKGFDDALAHIKAQAKA